MNEKSLLETNILNILYNYINNTSCIAEYDNWTDEFSRSYLKESREKLVDIIKTILAKDIIEISKKEAELLGFKTWATYEDIKPEIEDLEKSDLSDEEKTDRISKLKRTINLSLIPLYILPIIPIGTELIDIFGNTVIYDGKNIDTDIRYGCISYGLKFKEEEEC